MGRIAIIGVVVLFALALGAGILFFWQDGFRPTPGSGAEWLATDWGPCVNGFRAARHECVDEGTGRVVAQNRCRGTAREERQPCDQLVRCCSVGEGGGCTDSGFRWQEGSTCCGQQYSNFGGRCCSHLHPGCAPTDGDCCACPGYEGEECDP